MYNCSQSNVKFVFKIKLTRIDSMIGLKTYDDYDLFSFHTFLNDKLKTYAYQIDCHNKIRWRIDLLLMSHSNERNKRIRGRISFVENR